MEWLRKNCDRLALILAAAFLLVSVLSTWRKTTQLASALASPRSAPQPSPASLPRQAAELSAAREKLDQPTQWTFRGRSTLFVPEKHFIGADGLPVTLQTTELHSPVPNAWLEQFDLPIVDANVLDQDPDGDGFTNFEEWHGGTDPTNGDSRPDYVTKLQLKSATEEPFRLVFSSWVGDTFAINTIDLKQPTQFLKNGDVIRGTRFRIVNFSEKFQKDRYGTNMDVSELTLEHAETKQRLTLVKERVATSPESVATFVYTWRERREFQVRKDQEFSLKPHEEIKYKLVDVRPAHAVIVNIKTPQEPIEISLVP